MRYKVYDGLGNLVISTADFDLAWDIGMMCDRKNGVPRLEIERPARPIETLPFEPVPQHPRPFRLGRFFQRKKAISGAF